MEEGEGSLRAHLISGKERVGRKGGVPRGGRTCAEAREGQGKRTRAGSGGQGEVSCWVVGGQKAALGG